MASGIGDRLRARELELADAEVARRPGLAQSRYVHDASGRRAPDFQALARTCRALPTTSDALLRDQAAAALGAMDLRSLRLAADVLDVFARASGAGPEA